MDLSFLSKTPGIGGTIKNEPEDFIVEEITADGTILELNKTITHPDTPGRFVHFVIQKKNWSTSYAIKEIANRLHAAPKRFSYAGMKDKTAVTAQLVSAERFTKEQILSLSIKDISINGAWNAKDKVRLGALLGNRFTIRINGACEGADGKVSSVFAELGGKFPNYFGEQRFGSISNNTHEIGEFIVRGYFENAAISFLCGSGNEENEQARQARKDLRETRDFKAALSAYPKHLRFERSMLEHLSDDDKDFIGAFKTLPRQTIMLFVHAFQSHIFNRLLSDRIAESDGSEIKMEEGEYLCPSSVSSLGFPEIENMDVDGWLCMKILGYNSNPNEREKALLEELGISKEQFKIKELPEISSKGTFRTAFAPLVGFSFSDPIFRFSLQSGSYATSALREFLDVNKT